MEHQKPVFFHYEPRLLQEYMSTPLLWNPEENSQHLWRSRHRTDKKTKHKLVRRDQLVSEKSNHDMKRIDQEQPWTYTVSRVNRPQTVRSWHGLVNTQLSNSQKDTAILNSEVPRISSTSIDTLPLNLSIDSTDESDGSIKFFSHRSLNASLPWTQEITNCKPEINNNPISQTNGTVSISVWADHELLETISSEEQEQRKHISKQEASEPISKYLLLLGIAANFLVIGPLVVVYWSSTWNIFSHILFSDNCILSTWVSAAIGFSIMTAAIFLQDLLLVVSSKFCKPVRHIIIRIYTYIISIGCINQWRSVWIITHCYVDVSVLNSAVSFAVALFLLIVLRCLPCLPAPPVFVSLEVQHKTHYKVPTFWRSLPACSLCFMLDTVMSAIVVPVLVISCWRGLWEILDLYLVPEDHQMSAVWSVGISTVLSAVLLALHIPIKELSHYLHRKHWLLKLVFQDVVGVLYAGVSVAFWRGIWMFLDLYTPYRPESLYVGHAVSFIILTLGFTANSVLVIGVRRDDLHSKDYGVMINMCYVAGLRQACSRKREVKCQVNGVEERLPYHVSANDPVTLNIQ